MAKELESLMIEALIIAKENRIIGKWILAGAGVCIALLVITFDLVTLCKACAYYCDCHGMERTYRRKRFKDGIWVP